MSEEQVAVIQADRDAAARVARHMLAYFPHSFIADFPARIREGIWDNHWLVQSYARHRLATPAKEGVSTSGEVERVIRETIQGSLDERNAFPMGSDGWWAWENKRLGQQALSAALPRPSIEGELVEALEAIIRCADEGDDLYDCVDNFEDRYQSADLSKVLTRARTALAKARQTGEGK